VATLLTWTIIDSAELAGDRAAAATGGWRMPARTGIAGSKLKAAALTGVRCRNERRVNCVTLFSFPRGVVAVRSSSLVRGRRRGTGRAMVGLRQRTPAFSAYAGAGAGLARCKRLLRRSDRVRPALICLFARGRQTDAGQAKNPCKKALPLNAAAELQCSNNVAPVVEAIVGCQPCMQDGVMHRYRVPRPDGYGVAPAAGLHL
jgi:hypothetical protein